VLFGSQCVVSHELEGEVAELRARLYGSPPPPIEGSTTAAELDRWARLVDSSSWDVEALADELEALLADDVVPRWIDGESAVPSQLPRENQLAPLVRTLRRSAIAAAQRGDAVACTGRARAALSLLLLVRPTDEGRFDRIADLVVHTTEAIQARIALPLEDAPRLQAELDPLLSRVEGVAWKESLLLSLGPGESASRPYSTGPWAVFQRGHDLTRVRNELAYVDALSAAHVVPFGAPDRSLSGELLPTVEGFGSMVWVFASAEKELVRARRTARLARLVLALRAYRQEQGDWPADLGALEPLCPGASPAIDPVSGAAVEYEVVQGTPRLTLPAVSAAGVSVDAPRTVLVK